MISRMLSQKTCRRCDSIFPSSMFSGIVETTTRVRSARMRGGHRAVALKTPRGWRLKRGQSVAIDGICSTVVSIGKGVFSVEYMQETLDKTTAAQFVPGYAVNLERSLGAGSRIDGHFVTGHVDARGTVQSIRGNVLTVRVPRALARFVATKGSITVNGVALTVTHAEAERFSVALIPYTLAHTTLGQLVRGGEVNVEIDLLARYLDALLKKR